MHSTSDGFGNQAARVRNSGPMTHTQYATGPTNSVFRTSIDRSSDSNDSMQRKMTVFRQYTRTGESIQEMEMTPQKRKVDELMGRTSSSEDQITAESKD